MIRVIALTQLVFIALGTMALVILVKTQNTSSDTAGQLRLYLSAHGLWLLLIPFIWLGCVHLILRAKTGETVRNAVQASGIALTALILGLYAWLVLGA